MEDEEKRIVARAYLESVRGIKQSIDVKTESAQALKQVLLLQGIRYDKDPVKGSGCVPDRLAGIVSKAADIEAEADQLKELLAVRIADIVEMAEQLPSLDMQTVIVEYYLGRISMSDISLQLHYHRSRTYQIRDEALLSLYENNPKIQTFYKMESSTL